MEQKKFIKIVQELADCQIKPDTGLTVDKIIPQVKVCDHCETIVDTRQKISITYRTNRQAKTVGWVGRCNICSESWNWKFT